MAVCAFVIEICVVCKVSLLVYKRT